MFPVNIEKSATAPTISLGKQAPEIVFLRISHTFMESLRNRNLHAEDLPRYTLEDWKSWEGAWELIEGIPFAMAPMPNKQHQRINGKLYRLFSEALDACPSCEASLPVNFKVSRHTVLHPDLLVVRGEAIEGMYLSQVPQLVVEILSPTTRKKDEHTKPKIYQAAQVPYYLIVDPKPSWVKILGLGSGEYDLVQEGKAFTYAFPLAPCRVEIDFGKIWG